ncbi:hypothetical protein TSMEX_006164 [Taenia solium]|eukprot:TsM_000219800 transcript=TsM_000219800 gene=TsM_000219800
MAQGKPKLKKSGTNVMKHKKSDGSIKKNKGKMKKVQKIIPSKKQRSDLNNMKNFEKLLKQKVESGAAEKVSMAEPRSLKFVK